MYIVTIDIYTLSVPIELLIYYVRYHYNYCIINIIIIIFLLTVYSRRGWYLPKF